MSLRFINLLAMAPLELSLKGLKSFPTRYEFLYSFYKRGMILDVGNIGGVFGRGKSYSSHLKFKKEISTDSILHGFDLYAPTPESSHLYARQVRGNLQFGLPYKAEVFDTIYAGQVLEHMGNPLALLWEFRRLLKPDGILILDVPNAYGLKRIVRWLLQRKEFFGDPTHIILFTPLSLKTLLNSARFNVLHLTTDYKLGLPWPFKKIGLGAHILCCAEKRKNKR